MLSKFLAIPLIFLLALCGADDLMASMALPEVLSAAERDLPRYLDAIPSSDLARFGFDNRDQLDRVGLVDPIQLLIIPPDAVLDYSPGQDLAALLKDTGDWLFPVTCDGRARSFLRVTWWRDEWQAVDLGDAHLAAEIEALRRSGDMASGDSLALVRVLQAGCDFLMVDSQERKRLVPLRGTAAALGLIQPGQDYRYDELKTAEAMTRLAPLVRSNLESTGAPRMGEGE